MCGRNDILWTLITDVFAQKFATKSTSAIVAGHKENKRDCAIPNIKNALTIPTGSLVSTQNNSTAH